MNNSEIFFSENDELTEFEVQGKCWRGDIVVKIGENLYMPSVITPERLIIDFNNSIDAGRVLRIDEKLILVYQTDRNTIINILVKLIGIGYFSNIKTMDIIKDLAHYPPTLQDLKNWVKVY